MRGADRVKGAGLGRRVAALGAGLMLALGLLGAGCSGTERAVFALVDPVLAPPVPPPPGEAAAGTTAPVLDAGGEPSAGGSGPDLADAGVDASGPDPGLDPTVRFTWVETLPGAGTCRGGRYAGSFICSSVALIVPLTGEVSVLLSVDPEEQKLAIEEGTVRGSFFLAPVIEGGLDCPTRHFEGLTVDGMDLFTLEHFDATLSGTLDVDTLVIDGEFTLTNAAGQECTGTVRLGAAP